MEQVGGLPARDIYRTNLYKAFAQYLIPIIGDPTKDMTILSVGCQFGYEAGALLSLLPKSRFRGIDIDPRYIHGAEATNHDLSSSAEFIVADATDIGSFGEDPWDLIILRNPQILSMYKDIDPVSGDALPTYATREDWRRIIINSAQALKGSGIMFISSSERSERDRVINILSASTIIQVVANLENEFPSGEGFNDKFIVIGKK